VSPSDQNAREGYARAAQHRIHFVERGAGLPVLLIHGAFGSATRFLDNPFGRRLSGNHRVIAPDSLAHGESDAPPDPRCYRAEARASHLVAVLDALEIERAHVVGYSMGGWMASALAARSPERIASLSIGGWDVVNGMYTPAKAWGLPEVTYRILSEVIRRDRPDLLSWVRAGDEAGLAASINAMNELDGLAAAVVRGPAPVTFWMGRDDLYHAACAQFAEANGLPLITLPGDHITMLDDHGADAADQVALFIARSEARNGPESCHPVAELRPDE